MTPSEAASPAGPSRDAPQGATGRAAGPVNLGARPSYLLVAGHSCIAWWHAAQGDSVQPMAIVLAGSWGDEDEVGYDDLRALAGRLARAGFGVLRFEWPDTGDSSASTGATGVGDALAAFDAAAEAARAWSERGRLAFVGVRIGALLAAHAAAARRDVEAVVAMAPVSSGAAFLRDLAASSSAAAQSLEAAAAAGGAALQLGGYALPEARALELAALQWPATAGAGWAQSLLVGGAEPVAEGCERALARLGIVVARAPGPTGLPEVLAGESAATVERWLLERVHARPAAAVPAGLGAAQALPESAWLRTAALGVRVRERVCEISMPRANGHLAPSLAAVLTERDVAAGEEAPPFGPGQPRRAVLLLADAGGRRTGTHRLWVAFARERAARGEIVLRLDMAGTGDSAARSPHDAQARPSPYDGRCVDDIARAVAWLRREEGVGTCTVVGLGTGGHHAWRAAVWGIDLQHVIAVNPAQLHWPPVPDESDLLAADQPGGLRALPGISFLRRRLKALEASADRALGMIGHEIARAMGWRLVDDVANELEHVCRRGVHLDFVFSRDATAMRRLREEAGRQGRRLVRAGALRIVELSPREPTFDSADAQTLLLSRLNSMLAVGDEGPGGPPPPRADA